MKGESDVQDIPSTERGAVIVLVGLLITAFFGLVALAIDLTVYATSVQQSRNTAQLTALAALEKYFSEQGSSSSRLSQALTRAREVSKLGVVMSGAVAKDIQLSSNNSADPILQPGRYFFSEPAEGGNPCLTGEVVPCFVPAVGEDPVNAFRISGEIRPRATLRFARALFRTPELATPVSAIATVVPRHGCFVVDISGSMTRDSHKKETYFRNAYLLSADNPSITLPNNNNSSWNAMSSSPYQVRPGGGGTDPLNHYVSDFETRAVIGDENFTELLGDHHPTPTQDDDLYATGPERNFRVGVYRGNIYSGPEPLNTVFRGIDTAISLLKQRQVVGDMACIVFYDQKLNWSRVFKMTEDFDYLRKFTNPDILNDPENGLELMIRHGLFPQAGSMTNTVLGLSEAMRQLSSVRVDGIPSSDFVVLIGDGQTNCMNCSLVDPRYDYNGDDQMNDVDYRAFYTCMYPYYCDYGWWNAVGTCPSTPAKCQWLDGNGNGVVVDDAEDAQRFWETYNNWGYCSEALPCNNKLENYYFSMLETKRFVSRVYVPARVPIHTMLLGDESGPNTYDVEDPENPGTCLSDSRKRQLRNEPGKSEDFPSVSDGSKIYCEKKTWNGSCWGSSRTNESYCCYWDEWPEPSEHPKDVFEQRSAEKPFKLVNGDLYDIATMTGGIWAPIRKAPPGCTPKACEPAGGPRFEDPLCRTAQQQVQDVMEEVMRQNPFTLVVDNSELQ